MGTNNTESGALVGSFIQYNEKDCEALINMLRAKREPPASTNVSEVASTPSEIK